MLSAVGWAGRMWDLRKNGVHPRDWRISRDLDYLDYLLKQVSFTGLLGTALVMGLKGS